MTSENVLDFSILFYSFTILLLFLSLALCSCWVFLFCFFQLSSVNPLRPHASRIFLSLAQCQSISRVKLHMSNHQTLIVLFLWVVWKEGEGMPFNSCVNAFNRRRSNVSLAERKKLVMSSLVLFVFFLFQKESKSKSGSRRCRLQRSSRSASAPHLSTQPTLFASAFPTIPYSNVPFGIASSTSWPWGPTRSWKCLLVYSAMGSTRRTGTLWGAPCSRCVKREIIVNRWSNICTPMVSRPGTKRRAAIVSPSGLV